MNKQTLRETVGEVRLGRGVTHGALVIVPLHTRSDVKAKYVLLDQAIERGRLTVTEVNEAGSVPYLIARNRGPWPVLIFDGEELVGAKQNRIANVTILVGVGKTVLPVSCVEQGRWSARTRTFSAAKRASHPSLRSLKEEQVRRSSLAAEARERGRTADDRHDASAADVAQAERASRYRSDQGEVWREVEKTIHAFDAYAPTMALAASYDAGKDDLDEILAKFTPNSFLAPGDVVGTVVFWGGELVCLDLLQPAKRFGRLYPTLLQGYAFEAVMLGKQAAETLVPSDFDPEASTLRLLAEILEASVEEQPAVDLGEDVRLLTKRVSGAGLVWEKELIQLSVFPRKVA